MSGAVWLPGDRPTAIQRRIRLERRPPELSGRCHSHSRRTKSVIRRSGRFPPRLVTGEFYAWVTAGNVTRHRLAAKVIRDKRPVGRWLRSSSHNCADQGSIVIESLSKFSATSTAPKWPRTSRQSGRFCLANPEHPNKKFAGLSYSPVTISVPLAESRLEDVVDVRGLRLAVLIAGHDLQTLNQRWPGASARPDLLRPTRRPGSARSGWCRTRRSGIRSAPRQRTRLPDQSRLRSTARGGP